MCKVQKLISLNRISTTLQIDKSYKKTIGRYIVFVWSQYDGANIEQKTIGYGWRQNQKAKLKIVGGDLSGSNQQDLDPTIH